MKLKIKQNQKKKEINEKMQQHKIQLYQNSFKSNNYQIPSRKRKP